MNGHKSNNLNGASSLVGLVLLSLSLFIWGCSKQEEAKPYPQDRLTVEYTIDRDTIHLGDPVELVVTAYFPTNGTLELPELGRGKEIVLLEHDAKTMPRDDGLTQSETRYSVTSFRLGEHAISTNTITCQVGEQHFATNFPSITLQVQSALAENDTSTIEDIKPVQKLPGRVPVWIWLIAGSAALAFGIGLITAKLWKVREKTAPPAPALPPHVVALQALQALKQKGLLERDECNPFYTELSMILRTYLEGRFHLNAPDETTDEIVDEMSRSRELNTTQRNILQDFMRQADMVKFAKGHPDRGTMEAAFETTKQFVEETTSNDGIAQNGHVESRDPLHQPKASPGKTLAITGSALQFLSIIPLIFLVYDAWNRLLRNPQGSDRNIDSLVADFTQLPSKMILYSSAALLVWLIGMIVMLCALVKSKYRAAWFYYFLLVYSILLIPELPLGTCAGAFILIYILRHKAEFRTLKQTIPCD